MMLKHFSILMLTVFVTAFVTVPAVMGQSKDSEMSIEESYLQEAIELMIIRETSRSSSRDQKLLALEHIGNALERGSTNEELRTTLEYLSLEGTQNKTRMAGRLMNDYPDVRRQAAKHLGTVGTAEAKDALVIICRSENEPMVLQEAIKSLGTICINDNDDAVNAIVWVAIRNNVSTAPDNLVALATLDTLDKIIEKYKNMDPNVVQVVVGIQEGAYTAPVKERARQFLVNMRRNVSR